jgi:hypothetical protein
MGVIGAALAVVGPTIEKLTTNAQIRSVRLMTSLLMSTWLCAGWADRRPCAALPIGESRFGKFAERSEVG